MNDFEQQHDEYLQAWEDALATGDGAKVEAYLAAGYHGWFAQTSDRHVPYDREDGVEGMHDSVKSLRGSSFRTAHRTVCRRGPDQAVVSYEKLIERNGAIVGCAFIVEAWLQDGDRWLLCRELTEHGATVEATSR